MRRDRGIRTAKDAADDPVVVGFGRLQGAATRLEHILGRALEAEFGISHRMYEVLLILGRADGEGLSMRSIGREQVLTTGGVTRLIDRMEAADLVRRHAGDGDRRTRLVMLTPHGEQVAVRASRVHVQNIERWFLAPLPAAERAQFVENLRILSHHARDELPRLR